MATGPQLRAAIYGDPGVGKTTLALTFPRPFVLNTEGGIEGDALDVALERGFNPETDERRIVGHQDLTDSLRYFIAHKDDYDTIVIDSGDGLTNTLMNEITSGGTLDLDLSPDTRELREYGMVQGQFQKLTDLVWRMGKHIVMTFGVRAPEGGKRVPNLAPGNQGILNRWSNLTGELVVVRMDAEGNVVNKGEPRRVLMVDPSSKNRECKTRWAALLPYVLDPAFAGIVKSITDKKESH